MNTILHLLFTVLFVVVGANARAQGDFPKCLAKIQKRLDDLGEKGKREFNIAVVRQQIEHFDFGNLPDVVGDANKTKAFKRVYESLSEFIDLTGDQLSTNGLKGYTKFTGGIIRVDGMDFVADVQKVFGGTAAFDKQGFNAVMEHLNVKGTWRSQAEWESPGLLVYGKAPSGSQGHRITHIFNHTIPNPGKPTHSLFSAPRANILDLIDEGWKNPGKYHPLKPDNTPDLRSWIIDMGKQVGAAGETHLKIVVDAPGSSSIITSFPLFP